MAESLWECRQDPNDLTLSWIERGTGEDTETFLSVPLPYDDACKVEGLLEELAELKRGE